MTNETLLLKYRDLEVNCFEMKSKEYRMIFIINKV